MRYFHWQCRTHTSMPEVRWKRCIYFDPNDTDAHRLAMEQLWSDSLLRNQLISNARIQREKFSWVHLG
jgi:hypothetical protein